MLRGKTNGLVVRDISFINFSEYWRKIRSKIPDYRKLRHQMSTALYAIKRLSYHVGSVAQGKAAEFQAL